MDVVAYKRHAADCSKGRANRAYSGCGCKMMLEGIAKTEADVRAVASVFPGFITPGRFRLSANTNRKEDAEKKARAIERKALDILSGIVPVETMSVERAVETFMAAKRNAGLEEPTLQKLHKTTQRIKEFCDGNKPEPLLNLSDINLTHISSWEWSRYFKTTHSLITNQERVKAFFRYFHNAGVIAKNPAAGWQRYRGKHEQVSGFTAPEYQKILSAIPKAGFSPAMQPKIQALVELMRYGGLAIIDASTIERGNIVRHNSDYRVQLISRQKTSKKQQAQSIDNLLPPHVGKVLVQVLNGNPRYVFWAGGKSEEATPEEKREAVKFWQKQIRTLLDSAGFPDATSHKFRHTLAIEMIRAGAGFEDVAAALGNTVGVVAKFYSKEWEKQRGHKTDAAIKAAWAKTAR